MDARQARAMGIASVCGRWARAERLRNSSYALIMSVVIARSDSDEAIQVSLLALD
jgi:hypothetical protein